MDTELHRKIKSLCSIARRGEGHWILTGSLTIWVAELNAVFTTKRVAYAAFVGPVAEGEEVFSSCGMRQCVCPGHLDRRDSMGREARAIALPGQVEALKRPDTYRKPADELLFPAGLTLKDYDTVMLMTEQGNTIKGIRGATGLPTHEIIKIRAGGRDAAAGQLRKMVPVRTIRAIKNAKHPADISSASMGPAPPVPREFQGLPAEGKVAREAKVSEEEAQWLKSVGRG